jgi:hypothetical protein
MRKRAEELPLVNGSPVSRLRFDDGLPSDFPCHQPQVGRPQAPPQRK